MNGPPTVNQPTNTNEQLVGKFHVVNVDKVPASTGNTDETIATTNAVAASGGQAPVTDESSSVLIERFTVADGKSMIMNHLKI